MITTESKTTPYAIRLSPTEQRMELKSVADMISATITRVKRKRSLRESEMAMTLAEYTRRLTAVLMAIDQLDARS